MHKVTKKKKKYDFELNVEAGIATAKEKEQNQTLHSRQTTQNSKISKTKHSNLALLMLTLSWAFSSPTASFGDERK